MKCVMNIPSVKCFKVICEWRHALVGDEQVSLVNGRAFFNFIPGCNICLNTSLAVEIKAQPNNGAHFKKNIN